MIKIRNIEEKDIEKVVDIQIRSWQSTYKGIVDEDYLKNMNNEERLKQRIEKRKKDYKSNGFIVPEINNEVVGFCRYSDSRYVSNYDGIDCEIFALYIEPQMKRKGIGSALVKFVINEFKNKGYKKMAIGCLKENKSSRKFYEKIGGELYLERNFEIEGKNYKEVVYIYDVDEVYNYFNQTKAFGEIKLVFPTEEYKRQVEDYLQEHFDNGEYDLNGDGGLETIKDFDKWLKKIKNDRTRENVEDGRVPASMYLGIRKLDNKVVGTLQIRHELNEKLLKDCGHIGYGVRPSERKKGYVTEMIRLALDKAKKIGINRVLMVCYKDNIGSKKAIIKNGGVLENEIPAENGKIDQRYWISLKKKFANSLKNYDNVIQVEQRQKAIDADDFKGDLYLNNFIEISDPFVLQEGIEKGLCIQDSGYKWLEFYDYNSKIRLTAIYDDKNELIESYFDIARGIGKENNIPYEDDFYLDVVIRPDGKIFLLDENEFEEAYKKYEMTKKEYDEGYRLAYNLMEQLKGKEKQVKQFVDKYLNEMI